MGEEYNSAITRPQWTIAYQGIPNSGGTGELQCCTSLTADLAEARISIYPATGKQLYHTKLINLYAGLASTNLLEPLRDAVPQLLRYVNHLGIHMKGI
jgi:hypothetical protein